MNWSDLVKKLVEKKMGIEASEWRIRSLLMISAFHPVPEEVLNEQFEKIFHMYQKDKEKAKRILTIQKIDIKRCQEEMKENQIYLSDYEPEITSYFLLHNMLNSDKVEHIPEEECSQTQ